MRSPRRKAPHAHFLAPLDHTSNITANRAAEVVEAERTGRQRVIHFTKTGRELWDTAAGRLQTPVRKVRTVLFPIPNISRPAWPAKAP